MTVLKKEKKAAFLKKQLLRKSNCCVKEVTLEKFEEAAFPKIKLPWKVVTYARREIAIWKKETKLD